MSKELRIAKQIIVKAGEIIKKDFHSKFNTSYKGSFDLVTSTDLKSEKIIINGLTKAFPEYGIISEESKPHAKETSWIIDPLDGTVDFSKGFPYFGINIALKNKNEIILGVTYNPLTKELFWNEKGSESYCNGKKIHVSNTEDANIATVDVSPKLMSKICNQNLVRRLGSSAIAFTDVARGRLDDKIKSTPAQLWDYAAGLLLVEGAGGKVTDINGKPWTLHSTHIIASNSKIHNSLLNCLRS